MYGVPADLDLSFLKGASLAQVHLMSNQINFVFDPDGRIYLEGEWDLATHDGTVIDRYQPWPRTEPFQLHRLLETRVADWVVNAPLCLALQFENGLTLRLFDQPQYESFMIEPGNIIV